VSPAGSGVKVEHEPPGATQKSLGFALDDAMPKRDMLSGPLPVFESVTSATSLTEPTCTLPKSIASGVSCVLGPLTARADDAPRVQRAAAAVLSATSLRNRWERMCGVLPGSAAGWDRCSPRPRVLTYSAALACPPALPCVRRFSVTRPSPPMALPSAARKKFSTMKTQL